METDIGALISIRSFDTNYKRVTCVKTTSRAIADKSPPRTSNSPLMNKYHRPKVDFKHFS